MCLTPAEINLYVLNEDGLEPGCKSIYRMAQSSSFNVVTSYTRLNGHLCLCNKTNCNTGERGEGNTATAPLLSAILLVSCAFSAILL